VKGISAARTGQGRRRRSSKTLDREYRWNKCRYEEAGDEEKSRRRNKHSKDEARAENRVPRTSHPVIARRRAVFRTGLDYVVDRSGLGINVDVLPRRK
jgi:hypothetical protein